MVKEKAFEGGKLNFIILTNKISTFVVVRVIISGAGCRAGLLVDAPPVHRVRIAGLY